MIDYKKQYIKYKKKYLELKNTPTNTLFGGQLHYKFSNDKFSSVLPELNNTFLTYFVRDFSRHQGDDVSDHSIWTALVIADWINTENKWLSGIDSKYHDILVFSAFIHDIGNTGDGDFNTLISSYKHTHHKDGVDIILGKKKYITYSDDFDAAINSTIKDPKYNDERILNKSTNNALKQIDKYSTNIETMFKNAGFTIEELTICAMIVGMIDEFDELVVEPINKSTGKNVENSHFISYIAKFNELLELIKNHHKQTKTDSLTIDKHTLTRMCLAVSAANHKGHSIIEGKLDDLPIPTTVYPTSSFKKLEKKNLDKFLNKLAESSSKYEQYYKYVDKILELIKVKDLKKEKLDKSSPKLKKKCSNKNDFKCMIQ